MTDSRPLIPVSTEGLEALAGELLKPSTPPSPPGISEVHILDKTQFWSISGVPYRNTIETVDLAKNLLDNGNAKTQDDWILFSRSAKQSGEFYVGDFPLYHALFTTLFIMRDHPAKRKEVEEMRSFLKDKFEKYWLTTLTRIIYQPRPQDTIVHNKAMSDECRVNVDFIDRDEYVKDSQRPHDYKTLLGTDNLGVINSVYNWITGKDAYLIRINQRPTTVQERVAWFVADSARAVLGCGRYPSDANPALGVRVARAKK